MTTIRSQTLYYVTPLSRQLYYMFSQTSSWIQTGQSSTSGA